jgi:hypothetical protein
MIVSKVTRLQFCARSWHAIQHEVPKPRQKGSVRVDKEVTGSSVTIKPVRKTTRHNIPEERNLNLNQHKKFQSHMVLKVTNSSRLNQLFSIKISRNRV